MNFSPSVFAALPNKASVGDDKFCWSIEELATFQPIDIEKSPFVQSEATDHVMEAVAQAKINKFFSAKTILPSPAGPATVSKPLISTISPLAITPSPPPACSNLSSSTNTTDSSECDNFLQSQQKQRKLFTTTACQTHLSLPAVLPEALENMLLSYMKADGHLMKALYPDGYTSGDDDAEVTHTLSPLVDSPTLRKSLPETHFTDHRCSNNWQLSPITTAQHDEDSGGSGTSAERCLMRSRRSVAKLDFSAGHMSVDTSMAPQLCDNSDDLEGLEFHNNSVPSSTTPTRTNPAHNTSAPSGNDSSFSRMEDDYVTFHRSRSCVFPSPSAARFDILDMDISFSNTPKSRSASATRRRLCDSFASFGDEEDNDDDEEDKDENEEKVRRDDDDDTVESGSPKKYKPDDNLIRRHDEISSLIDVGYNTASTFEESSLCFEKNTPLFASTPTKMKTSFFPTNE